MMHPRQVRSSKSAAVMPLASICDANAAVTVQREAAEGPPLARSSVARLRQETALRQKAEAETRSAHDVVDRMQRALEQANTRVWNITCAFGTVRLSAITAESPGRNGRDGSGSEDPWVTRVHPDDRASLIDTIRQAMVSGTAFCTQHRTRSPDGTVRWVESAGCALPGQDGEVVRGVGISMDITDRRAVDVRHRQAQKMAAVGRLATGVAHDFNNLLTVILGYCDMLGDGSYPSDARPTAIAEIRSAAMRATGLTHQLLAFSREEPIAPQLLDLNSVVTRVERLLRRLIGEDVTITIDLDPELEAIKADRGQMEQIIVNLAVNARDAMPTGGAITIRTTNVDIDEGTAGVSGAVQAGRHVLLRVSDTGGGMSPEVRARAFEPYFTTKSEGEGTGLGLAIVHSIVGQCGGAIRVHSEVGLGTTFQLYFPSTTPAS